MTGEVLHLTGPVIVGDDDVRPEAWVIGDRITFERPVATVPVATERVDGWVVPGLVDVHCHIGLDAQGGVDREVARAQAVADRDAGVLLVRDAGSPVDTRWLDDDAGAPRLLRAGRHLARPKRYLRHYGRELAAVTDLPRAVGEEAGRGDGWVKVVADWIDRDLDAAGDLRPLWPDDILAEAVAVAHRAGARVTAHTFATEAADGLLAAGVDCLEHGTGLRPEHIDEVARRGIPVTATLLQVARFEDIAAQADARYPVYAARMRRMHARRHEHVRNLADAGVRLLVGTDAGGTIGHGQIAAECLELTRAGLSAADVLAIASWRARDFLGVDGLDEGTSADLVVYPSDPRADVRVLAAPEAVVLRGRRVTPGR